MNGKFFIGDTVRRINTKNGNVRIGDTSTIVKYGNSRGEDIDKYVILDTDPNNGHNICNLSLIRRGRVINDYLIY